MTDGISYIRRQKLDVNIDELFHKKESGKVEKSKTRTCEKCVMYLGGNICEHCFGHTRYIEDRENIGNGTITNV